jgi:hypothetical protein
MTTACTQPNGLTYQTTDRLLVKVLPKTNFQQMQSILAFWVYHSHYSQQLLCFAAAALLLHWSTSKSEPHIVLMLPIIPTPMRLTAV